VKAITLHQPWATLIAIGMKRQETRGWNTQHRGVVAIHAGKAMPDYLVGPNAQTVLNPFDRISQQVTVWRRDKLVHLDGVTVPAEHRNKPLPLGAVVAVAVLADTRSTSHPDHLPTELEDALGDHTEDRWAWALTQVYALPEPIPASGAQGLWEWEPGDDVVDSIRAGWESVHRPEAVMV
jgi:hypothetical protein